MKIVFLDIDGVLCTERAIVAAGDPDFGPWPLDPVAVALVGRLADIDPDLRFVLSSDWRTAFTHEEIATRFKNHGFIGRWHEDWRTPSLASGRRGQEIEAWLENHPEVDLYVCIDDRKRGYGGVHPIVHVRNHEDGFGLAHFRKACCILFNNAEAWRDAHNRLTGRSDDGDKKSPGPCEPGDRSLSSAVRSRGLD